MEVGGDGVWGVLGSREEVGIARSVPATPGKCSQPTPDRILTVEPQYGTHTTIRYCLQTLKGGSLFMGDYGFGRRIWGRVEASGWGSFFPPGS